MLKLMDKKMFIVLRSFFCLFISTYAPYENRNQVLNLEF